MRILNAILGLLIMPFKVRVFRPEKIFKGKRVAIIGAADSAFDKENGAYIDGFDYVVRVNKSLITWNKENEKYLGTKCDVLIHSFRENIDRGGGGKLDWGVFNEHGVQYLVQPRSDKSGIRNLYNYFKKYLNVNKQIYICSRSYYSEVSRRFKEYHPTKGFCGLDIVLDSYCSEVFITGFTFFKTPYATGYRDELVDVASNEKHIREQGVHSQELEFLNFLEILTNTNADRVVVDSTLYKILSFEAPDLINRVKLVND